MKSSVETLSPTRVKMTVEVPYEELKPSINAALTAIGAQISVPGFRPGKVPARLIEQRVGKGAVIQEAVNEALPELYVKALGEHDLRPLGQPEVDLDEVPAADGDPLVFTAEVDVRPAIELPDFGTIEVVVDEVDPDAVEAEKDSRLDALRTRFGTLLVVARPAAEGDVVTIDLRGVIDDEEIDAVSGVSYEIGTRTMIEGLDDALVGLSVDEEKTFEAPLAGGDRAGQDATITVTVSAVKERQLPDLDDDFAQLASEFDTFAELEDDLREQARKAKVFEQGIQARDKILDTLLHDIDIPVPEALIEAQVDSHFAEGTHGDGEDSPEHREQVEADARKALRSQLLLDTIAERHEVEVTQQELIEYLIQTAQQYGMEPGQLAQAVDDQNQIGAMASEVARRKALATVMEQAKVTDSAGELVDLSTPVDDDLDVDLDDDDDLDDDEAGDEADGAGASAEALAEEGAADAEPATPDEPTLSDQADAELDAATGEEATDPLEADGDAAQR